jgi:hypothetical protein
MPGTTRHYQTVYIHRDAEKSGAFSCFRHESNLPTIFFCTVFLTEIAEELTILQKFQTSDMKNTFFHVLKSV